MDDFEKSLDVFMSNPFVMSVFGMMMYFFLVSGGKLAVNPKMKFLFILKNQGWHMFIGLFVCFAMVAYDDDITKEYNELYDSNFVWPWYFYLLGGVWLHLLYQSVAQVPKIARFIRQKFFSAK